MIMHRTPASMDEASQAYRLAEWIEHNIIEKWFVIAEVRYFVNRMVNGALTHLPNERTGWLIDKVWIAIQLGFMSRRVLGSSSLFEANQSRTPDEWWNDFWTSNYTTIEGDGALQWDLDNPEIHNRSTPPYYSHDTLHDNRFGRGVSYAMFAGDPFPARHKALALSKTVTQRIWNGQHGEGMLISNYITGETGHDYHGSTHPVSGTEGWGWIYNGFGELFWDPEIDGILTELLDVVRRGEDVSATYVRHSTAFGKIGLCGSIMWNPYAREQHASS
jgi:hypothetical protein